MHLRLENFKINLCLSKYLNKIRSPIQATTCLHLWFSPIQASSVCQIEMMKTVQRGALIVIEGVDRSGKSTQCKKLVESLISQNIKAQLMNFPDRSNLTGKLINEYLINSDCKLNDRAIHLLFSANRWENVEKMNTLLYGGTTLVVDRYSYSGIAFSAAKGGMDMNWLKQAENGLPKPDLVFLLTLNHEEAAKRVGFGEERYENEAMQKKVSNIFSQLAKEEDNWRVIEASDSIESLQAILLGHTLDVIARVAKQELKSLHFQT
ncbi:thymidylate kinase [Dendroctonus ponderosae]|nr:thymidylate kinase [Dendroctonus ponderosae]